VAWIYLNYKETESQTPPNIVGSFLKQLILGLNFIPRGLQEQYHHHHVRQTRPTAEELLKEFPSIIAGYSQVYLLIDGFDECPEDRRRILYDILATVGGSVCLMITSRPHIGLDFHFPDIQVLDIRPADDDIRRYVDKQISKSPPLSKHVRAQPQLGDEIRAAIAQNAQGM
jgi:hypothetical protein